MNSSFIDFSHYISITYYVLLYYKNIIKLYLYFYIYNLCIYIHCIIVKIYTITYYILYILLISDYIYRNYFD